MLYGFNINNYLYDKVHGLALAHKKNTMRERTLSNCSLWEQLSVCVCEYYGQLT